MRDDVPDLAGQTVGAPVEPPVEDDAGGDAGPDREVGQVVDTADDTAPVEAQGRGTDVVLEEAGRPSRASSCGPSGRS